MAMEQIDTAAASNRFVVPDGPRLLNVRIRGIALNPIMLAAISRQVDC